MEALFHTNCLIIVSRIFLTILLLEVIKRNKLEVPMDHLPVFWILLQLKLVKKRIPLKYLLKYRFKTAHIFMSRLQSQKDPSCSLIQKSNSNRKET